MWSLGVTLHRVLTGQSIYGMDLPEDDSLLALRKALVTEPRIAPGLPAPCRTSSASASARPRPATAEEFARQLNDIQLVASPG